MWIWAAAEAQITVACNCQQRKKEREAPLSLYFRLVTCLVCAEALLTACQSEWRGLAPLFGKQAQACVVLCCPAKTYRLKDPYSLHTHTHKNLRSQCAQTCSIDWCINKVTVNNIYSSLQKKWKEIVVFYLNKRLHCLLWTNHPESLFLSCMFFKMK